MNKLEIRASKTRLHISAEGLVALIIGSVVAVILGISAYQVML